jgi:ferredoxin-thioredoxin reductase catalytic chain
MKNLNYIILCSALVALVVGSASAFLPQGAVRTTTKQTNNALFAKKELTQEEYDTAMKKATKAMTAFTNKYLENTCTTLCTDKSVPAVVIKGLAEHKVNLGAPLCPCRFYDDKEAEVKDGYWNCPCVPMRERHECHCMLFLTEDNDFAGEEQVRLVEQLSNNSLRVKQQTQSYFYLILAFFFLIEPPFFALTEHLL